MRKKLGLKKAEPQINKRQWLELKKSVHNFPEGWTKKDNEGSWIYKGQWRKII